MIDEEGCDRPDNLSFSRTKVCAFTLCALVNIGEIAAVLWDPVDHAYRFSIEEIDSLVARTYCGQVFLGNEVAGLAIGTNERRANLLSKLSALIPFQS